MDFQRIMTREEVQSVVRQLKEQLAEGWWASTHTKLIVFRLATCCGLRRGEIGRREKKRGSDEEQPPPLQLSNVYLSGPRPHLVIPKRLAKGTIDNKKVRRVPLWWDSGTFEDILEWYEMRVCQTRKKDGPFVSSMDHRYWGRELTVGRVSQIFKETIAMTLGENRAAQMSVHDGRHTFASLAHQAGISLVNIQQALGHSSIQTTSIYMHGLDDGKRDIFS